ncbi:hypothetical protein [Bradyrhizobium elkanii]|uniref:hypothetical protein n=1 Tax=Bradyrhizobium elkanii TaxID=29448 RepID=UPI0020A0636D|nr:hypothetical protein [Bradyrhizobium elkanii]MCP1969695.1 hypothetical protein [Bradyrhizobium elkanii]MCS4108797.1 hypothetical protein [Bradyrhizobium elkanii]
MELLVSQGAPRLPEENPYRSGWRPPGWGRFQFAAKARWRLSKVDRHDSHSSMPGVPSFELIDALVFCRWWMQMEFIGRPMRGRFLVRQGGNGWMVYDSELKGPAQIEKNGAFAEKLTKEQAEILAERLATRQTGF